MVIFHWLLHSVIIKFFTVPTCKCLNIYLIITYKFGSTSYKYLYTYNKTIIVTISIQTKSKYLQGLPTNCSLRILHPILHRIL
jgi:hypothetical protein